MVEADDRPVPKGSDPRGRQDGAPATGVPFACHFVHFFASRQAGDSWTQEHGGTFLLSLDEAFEVGQRVNALNSPSVAGAVR